MNSDQLVTPRFQGISLSFCLHPSRTWPTTGWPLLLGKTVGQQGGPGKCTYPEKQVSGDERILKVALKKRLSICPTYPLTL